MNLLVENPRGAEKFSTSQKLKSHNPKTLKHVHKIFGIQSDTSWLINCGKVFNLSIEK